MDYSASIREKLTSFVLSVAIVFVVGRLRLGRSYEINHSSSFVEIKELLNRALQSDFGVTKRGRGQVLPEFRHHGFDGVGTLLLLNFFELRLHCRSQKLLLTEVLALHADADDVSRNGGDIFGYGSHHGRHGHGSSKYQDYRASSCSDDLRVLRTFVGCEGDASNNFVPIFTGIAPVSDVVDVRVVFKSHSNDDTVGRLVWLSDVGLQLLRDAFISVQVIPSVVDVRDDGLDPRDGCGGVIIGRPDGLINKHRTFPTQIRSHIQPFQNSDLLKGKLVKAHDKLCGLEAIQLG